MRVKWATITRCSDHPGLSQGWGPQWNHFQRFAALRDGRPDGVGVGAKRAGVGRRGPKRGHMMISRPCFEKSDPRPLLRTPVRVLSWPFH